jgi:hypothetical protein
MNWNSKGKGLFFAAALVVVIGFVGFQLSANGKSAVAARAKEGSDPRREMITVLPTAGPHPSLGDKAKLFDHFVGTWDTDYTFYAADGTVSKRKGEVLFGWIIDGRALQDIWISYPKEGGRDLGTTIRFYDAKTAIWRVVWIYPAGSVITVLTGGAVGDGIVLRGQAADGGLLRWSFNEIRADSFVWRGEVSYNNGETWRLTDVYQMRRRKAGAG